MGANHSLPVCDVLLSKVEFNAAVFRYVHAELNPSAWRLAADSMLLSSNSNDGSSPLLITSIREF
jgi:hypothetical protein